MSRNDAYPYAKKLRRKHLSNKELEEMMFREGYSTDDLKLVKWWLNHSPAGI